MYESGKEIIYNQPLPKNTLGLLRLANKLKAKRKNKKKITQILLSLLSELITLIAKKIRPGQKKYKMPDKLFKEYEEAYKKPRL